MKHPVLAGIVAAVALLPLAPLEARRIVVDEDPEGNATSVLLQGYCDFNGDDCSPIPLGYSVDFGSGALSSVIIYGNGLLSFGDEVADLSTTPGSLVDYAVPVVSPGIDDVIEPDFEGSGQDVFLQSAALSIAGDGTLIARFFNCFTPQSCNLSPYVATLQPTLAGYKVSFSYSDVPPQTAGGLFTAGYSVAPGAARAFDTAGNRSFVIPATFSGLSLAPVPEPLTWTTMILGFGLAGSAVRTARRAQARATM